MLSSWGSRGMRPCSMGNIKQNINTAIIDCAMVFSITITQTSFSSTHTSTPLPPLPHTHLSKSIAKPQSHFTSHQAPTSHVHLRIEVESTSSPPLETKPDTDPFILLPPSNTPCVSMISKFSPAETTSGVDSVPIVPKNTEREKPVA